MGFTSLDFPETLKFAISAEQPRKSERHRSAMRLINLYAIARQIDWFSRGKRFYTMSWLDKWNTGDVI